MTASWIDELRVCVFWIQFNICATPNLDAMKHGASDLVSKPLDKNELIFEVRKFASASRHLEASSGQVLSRGGMAGSSGPMLVVYTLVEKAGAAARPFWFVARAGPVRNW